MNPLKKLVLYPIVTTAIIMLITLCNWLLTAFFAWIFDTTINNVALSPIILLYIVSSVATLYLCVLACEYIDEQL
jgi:energy-converting hydrogenase Eha subunit C